NRRLSPRRRSRDVFSSPHGSRCFGRLSPAMIVYPGSVEDAHELIQFFRKEVDKLRALRKLIINREKTVVWDVNKDGMEFPGLTYGCASLDELLRELGVVFKP